MKRVFSTELLAEVSHLRNVLEQNGIACVIRNEQLSGALGEVPFLECMPELWVVDDRRLAEAERILAEQRAPAPPANDWFCRHCDEPNEGHFAACWNCGSGADPD